MSNIDKEGIIIIVVSMLITLLFVMCIKCYYKQNHNSKYNDFNIISQSLNNSNILNNEKTRLI